MTCSREISPTPENENSIIVNCVYSVDDYYIDFNNAPPTKIIQPGGSEFYLDLCGQENKCANGALCEKKSGLHTEWEPIGDINQVTVEKDLQLTSAIKFEIKIKQADIVSDKCPNLEILFFTLEFSVFYKISNKMYLSGFFEVKFKKSKSLEVMPSSGLFWKSLLSFD